MRYSNMVDAQTLRRAAAGPHALMLRRALQPYVPDRGGHFMRGNRALAGFGDLLSTAGNTVTGAKVGLSVGTTIASATSAATAGAAAGSFAPIIGTAIGAIVGLALSGAFSHRVDPEVGNFNAAVALYNSQGASGLLNIGDKYLVLAGLFDLEPSQIKGNIPIYRKYGRMGEFKFLFDLCTQVYNAAQTGKITANDTVQSVFSKVVQPWIDSFGYGPMQDVNAGMIQTLLLGLTAEYIAGLYESRWYPVGGQAGIWNALPPFSLPSASVAAPAGPSATPARPAAPTMPAATTTTNYTNVRTAQPAPSPPQTAPVQGSVTPSASTDMVPVAYPSSPAQGTVYLAPSSPVAYPTAPEPTYAPAPTQDNLPLILIAGVIGLALILKRKSA